MRLLCIVISFFLVLPLFGTMNLGVHPGINIFSDAVGYGGLLTLDWGFGADGDGLYVQSLGGLFSTDRDGFTIRNLFVGFGVGFRVPLGADFHLVPGLSCGLGFDRRQEGSSPAADHTGFVALASLALEYRVGENLGLSATAFPFLVDNDRFRTLSTVVTLGINWRFGRSSSLASEVQKSGFFRETTKDDGGRMRIDLPDLSFDPGSSRLTAETRAALESLAIRLSRYSVRGVVVAGHTDDTGRAAENEALSIRRAEAVASALVAGGFEKGKIKASGYGSTCPRYPNDNESNRRRNRRVEITITE